MSKDPDLDWITEKLRRAAVADRAPAHLRLRIDAMSQRTAASRRPARRARVLVPAAGLLAALAVVLVLALSGGTPGGPTVAQAAAVGIQPISYAPPPDGVHQASEARVYARFADVRFPSGLGIWNFEGWRIARLDGRRMLTIYYAHGDDEISYSVAATPVLAEQKPGFTSFRLDGRAVISWQESDHSCQLSSAQASRAVLLAIARS